MDLMVAEKEKQYQFRTLNSTDLFPMIKIISKIGIDELTQVFDGNLINGLINRAKDTTDEADGREGDAGTGQKETIIVGIGIALKLANKILEHLPCCENEIYTLLANVSAMDIEAVKALPLNIFLEMLLDFIMKDEFKSFFLVASKYIGRLK